jgi:ubiquinone/menaquinone biosynthesis C-methylase UbiE
MLRRILVRVTKKIFLKLLIYYHKTNSIVRAIVDKLFNKRRQQFVQKDAVEGYDTWAESYDCQPGNLMLDFDEDVFTTLLSKVDLKGKVVADIGCGTGRNWNKIYAKGPAFLTGFDVSQGMLDQLKAKFPGATVSKITSNGFQEITAGSFDFIISTLTVAHIEDMREAIETWCRMLTITGEMIITDFHPVALAKGGRRTFKNRGEVISITNYVHPIQTIKQICFENGMTAIAEEERVIDETVKHYFQLQHAMHVYKQFEGVPMIYGLYLKRSNDPK